MRKKIVSREIENKTKTKIHGKKVKKKKDSSFIYHLISISLVYRCFPGLCVLPNIGHGNKLTGQPTSVRPCFGQRGSRVRATAHLIPVNRSWSPEHGKVGWLGGIEGG